MPLPAGWLAQLQQSPGLLAFIGIIGVVGLLVGFSSLRRYRLIEDIPTARVRSAPQGYVELHGQARALPGEPIVAPLSQTPCCWYSFRVEQRAGKNWRTIDSGTSDGLFLLRDETGECLIDPEGAEIDTTHSQTWHGSAAGLGLPGLHRLGQDFGPGFRVASRVLGASGALLGGGQRYTERVILEGDPLYAIGWFHSLDDSDFRDSERVRMQEILREWKAHPERLRERFDLDRNGTIDLREWQLAREQARRQAREELEPARNDTHVHVLRKPPQGIYLIANREESALVRRLRWRARIGLGLFGLALLIDGLALAGMHLG